MSEASSSTPKPSTSSKPDVPSADDIERLLNREATAFQREMEVERILKAFKLKYVVVASFSRSPRRQLPLNIQSSRFSSPYELLDLGEEATPEEIKKKYRQLSLCEHLPSDPSPPLGRRLRFPPRLDARVPCAFT